MPPSYIAKKKKEKEKEEHFSVVKDGVMWKQACSQSYVRDINENVTREPFPLSKKVPPPGHAACPIPTLQALLTSPLLAPCSWHLGVCFMREWHKGYSETGIVV